MSLSPITGDSTDTPTSRKWRPHGCWVALATFIFLICVALLAAPHVFRWRLMRSISPAAQANIERFMKTPVAMPADWATPMAPIPPEGTAAVSALRQEYAKAKPKLISASQDTSLILSLINFAAGQPPAEDAWSSISLVAKDAEATVRAQQQLVAIPGYSMEWLVALYTGHELMTDLALWTTYYSYHRPRAEITSESLQVAMLPLKLTRGARRPQGRYSYDDTLDTQLHGLATLAALLARTDEKVHLVDALAELNRGVADFALLTPEQLDIEQPYGNLRYFARDGYPVDLSPGKPGSYYGTVAFHAILNYPAWLIERLPLQDPRRPDLERVAVQLRFRGFGPKALSLLMSGYNYLSPESQLMNHYSLDRDRSHTFTDLKRRKAQFDLLRAYIALRIKRREGVDEPTAAWSLLPDSLGQPLPDPFAPVGTPYQYSGVRQQFYSVGSNGVDDGATTLALAAGHGGPEDLMMPLAQDRFAPSLD